MEDFGTTPLSVTISYMAATRSGTKVNYVWQTATEAGVAGFNILVETEGGLAQLNEELIVSKVIDSVTPTDYRFAAMTDAETFYIDQIGIDGVQSRHGPFTVGQVYGSQSRPDGVGAEVTIWLPLIQR